MMIRIENTNIYKAGFSGPAMMMRMHMRMSK